MKKYNTHDLLGYERLNLSQDEVLDFVKSQIPMSDKKVKKLTNALKHSSSTFEYVVSHDGCEILITNG